MQFGQPDLVWYVRELFRLVRHGVHGPTGAGAGVRHRGHPGVQLDRQGHVLAPHDAVQHEHEAQSRRKHIQKGKKR